MVWPGGNGMVLMAWQTWHCIWYGLAGMAWYMLWPGRAWRGIWYYLGRHGIVYGMAWWAWYGICYGLTGIWYGLADMAWYMVLAGGHDIVYCMAWRVMVWLMVWPGGQWHGLWYGLANWKSCSHVQDQFTSRGTVACSVHMYSSCSLWAVTVNWKIVNIYITVLG